MIDTLTIQSEVVDVGRALEKLHEPEVRDNPRRGMKSYHTKLNNLDIMLMEDGGLGIRGSLARYFLGNNVLVLTRSGIRYGIEQLSEELGADLAEGRVFRFDLGTTLPVQKPIRMYTSHFVEASRYDLERNSNGNVTFKHSRRSLLFYDKQKEQKKGGYEFCGSSHYLRYELQFKTKLKAQFKRSLYVKDLYNSRFFEKIVNRWVKEYLAVNKKRLPCLHGVNNPKGFFNYLQCNLIEILGGIEFILDLAKGIREAGQIGDTQFHRIKRKIFDLNECANITKQSDAIQELDGRIIQFAEMIKSCSKGDFVDATTYLLKQNCRELSPIGKPRNLLKS